LKDDPGPCIDATRAGRQRGLRGDLDHHALDLPANLAVALHPDFVYAAVETGDGEVLILARELVDDCMKTFGIDRLSHSGRDLKAQDLENKRCRHPFYDRDSLIILGDHVTLEAGTGCVHTAPGHGREDYEVGLQYGLDAYSPVNDNGVFTDEVDRFAGQFVFKANDQHQSTGCREGARCWPKPRWPQLSPLLALQAAGDFPGHAPVVHLHGEDRAAQKSLEEIDRVKWIPHWGRERIYGMIENRPDWCVPASAPGGFPSRFLSAKNATPSTWTKRPWTASSISLPPTGPMSGSKRRPPSCCRKETVCASCGRTAFVKETDILDVWFDSGVSHAAVLGTGSTCSGRRICTWRAAISTGAGFTAPCSPRWAPGGRRRTAAC
jgi:isoleucyl-tRNA synthetase